MSQTSIRYERWRPLIEASRNEDALMAVMREYCDTLLPSDIAKLPAAAPQYAINSVADIGDLAVGFTWVDLKYESDDETRMMLHDLALTFCAAAEQLKRLRHPMLRLSDG